MRQRGQIGKIDEFSADRQSWRRLSEFQQIFAPSKTRVGQIDDVANAAGRSEAAIAKRTGAQSLAIDDAVEWYYCSEGEKHGPFSENAVLELIEQGEIQDCDLVWRQGFKDWEPAIDHFLFSIESMQPWRPSSQTGESASTAPAGGNPVPMVQPERGTVILTLAIVGLLLAPAALLAWVLGAGDLSDMRSGTRNSQGRATTTWGMALGIVGTTLWVTAAAYLLFVFNRTGSVDLHALFHPFS
jgi:hypothetical protein